MSPVSPTVPLRWGPSPSGVVPVQDQLPEASVVAVHSTVPPEFLTVTVVPGREVPV